MPCTRQCPARYDPVLHDMSCPTLHTGVLNAHMQRCLVRNAPGKCPDHGPLLPESRETTHSPGCGILSPLHQAVGLCSVHGRLTLAGPDSGTSTSGSTQPAGREWETPSMGTPRPQTRRRASREALVESHPSTCGHGPQSPRRATEQSGGRPMKPR